MRQGDKTKSDRIVVVGGGAGGAELATALGRKLARTSREVVLVDCVASHLWKPRLHEVAVGLINPGEDEVGYLALGQSTGFRFVMGALTALDAQARTISIGPVTDESGREVMGAHQLDYGLLVLSFGSEVNDFGIKGVAEHCHMLDSCEQASAFQRRLFEAAVQVAAGAREQLRIGIVGAGATGVELAAELHQAVDAMKRYGGLAGVNRLEITLIDMASRVLANEAPKTSQFAHRALERLGVELRLDASVDKVSDQGFHLKGGDVVPCELKVWASGVIGRPLAAELDGLQTGKDRRIACDGWLRCKGMQDIYAFGDCAAVTDPATGKPLPATAQVAHQQAGYLTKVLAAKDRGAPKPFHYTSRGSLVSLGGHTAAGQTPIPGRGESLSFDGALPKLFYVSLQIMHRAALSGWTQAAALTAADRLRRVSVPPVKLH